MPRVLIVDDEESIRGALRQVFEYEDHEVVTAEDGPEALESFESFRPHVTFLDVKMSGLDGLEVLSRIRRLDASACVVMISGHGTIDIAVEATHKGAFDFLEKPLDTSRLLVTLRNALELRGLTENVQLLRSQVGTALLNVEAFSEFKENAEMVYITHKLRVNEWNVSETARQIDMPRSNLYKKIEKYGLNREK